MSQVAEHAAHLDVALGERSYAIEIAPGLIRNAQAYAGAIRGQRVLIVTDDTVAPLYLGPVQTTLAGQYTTDSLVLPDGEAHKTLATTAAIYDKLLEGGYGRDATVVALGGGVIGDVAGFAAATYQRGIDFVQLPTTLLAQVDSSVGGKTGVNHPLGKNMIGAFHQPTRVLADIDVLASLPPRQFAAGLAEVIKYGLIRDGAFFDWLEAYMPRLNAREPAIMIEAIRRSCANKAEVVAADEREAGQRALLNLGHTFGHAVEAALGYGEWLHGEAVGAGMCLAADLSVRMGWLAASERDRAVALIAAANLPTGLPGGLTRDQMLELMARDKKALAGQLRLILLHGIGKAVTTAEFDAQALTETLDAFLAAA